MKKISINLGKVLFGGIAMKKISILLVVLLLIAFQPVLASWFGFFLPDGEALIVRLDKKIAELQTLKAKIETEFPKALAKKREQFGDEDWWGAYEAKAKATADEAVHRINYLIEELTRLRDWLDITEPVLVL